jgi:hypothetical protein
MRPDAAPLEGGAIARAYAGHVVAGVLPERR